MVHTQTIRSVYLTRGAPGIGKGAWIAQALPGVTVYSAAAFLATMGAHNDPTSAQHLGAAHGACLRAYARDVMSGASPTIAVENTNATRVELAPYVSIALAFGLQCTIVQFPNHPDRRAWVDGLVKRNRYRLTRETIERIAWRIAREASLPKAWRGVRMVRAHST